MNKKVIPYEWTQDITKAIGMPKSIVNLHREYLLDLHMHSWAYDDNRAASRRTVNEHVLRRTLLFSKLVEFICSEEVANGHPHSCTGPAGVKQRQCKDTMKKICEENYLIRIDFSEMEHKERIDFKLAVPNLPLMVMDSMNRFRKSILSRIKSISELKPTNEILLALHYGQPLANVGNDYGPVFNYLQALQDNPPTGSIENLLADITNHTPAKKLIISHEDYIDEVTAAARANNGKLYKRLAWRLRTKFYRDELENSRLQLEEYLLRPFQKQRLRLISSKGQNINQVTFTIHGWQVYFSMVCFACKGFCPQNPRWTIGLPTPHPRSGEGFFQGGLLPPTPHRETA